MNSILSKLIQLGVVATVSVTSANYVGKEVASEVDALLTKVAVRLEAVNRH